MKYFKNIKSYEDLKAQYKELLKANHPDNGGDVEIMKEINVQFDSLFAIWKNRKETETHEIVRETADSVRMEFYTQFGWKGSNHDWNRTLKEIAQIVRAYVKEKYSTCKFSVRTSYASMCQELHVAIKEFPEKMFKTGDDLRKEGLCETVETTSYSTGELYTYTKYTDEIEKMHRMLRRSNLFNLDSWTDEELIEAYEKALEKSPHYYGIKTEYFQSVLDDVNAFVNSYNYKDCDGMIDYFDVDFYYFNCKYEECKIVPKTSRIKNKSGAVAASKEKLEIKKPNAIERKYTYDVKEGTDTRDGSKLWIVKILDELTKSEYIKEKNAIKKRGGYYSKFKHGFVFRENPAEMLV